MLIGYRQRPALYTHGPRTAVIPDRVRHQPKNTTQVKDESKIKMKFCSLSKHKGLSEHKGEFNFLLWGLSKLCYE